MEKVVKLNTILNFKKNNMQAARAEKILIDKLYYMEEKGNTIVVNNAYRLAYYIFEGYDFSSYTHNNKMKYKLTKECLGFDLLKTEYDFCAYLKENFQSLSEVMDFDAKCALDKKTLEEEKRKEEAKREEEQKKEEAKREYFEKIATEPVPQSVIDMIDNITIKKWGHSGRQDLYTLYILVKNIQNEYCRDELCGRLNNNNKTSIKIVESICKVKLPSSYSARIDFINSMNLKICI